MALTGRALILITGEDKSGVSHALFSALSPFTIHIIDIEQVVIRGRLILTILIAMDPNHISAIEGDLLESLAPFEMDVAIDLHAQSADAISENSGNSYFLTVVANAIAPSDINSLTEVIAKYAGNIESVRRTADLPVTAIEFHFSLPLDCEIETFRSELRENSKDLKVDIALEVAGLGRKAKRIVFLDMDSTFIQQEVIDLLAEKAGVGSEVSRVTEAAMRGELDFSQSLTQRTALLANAPAEIFEEVSKQIVLTPGAKTLVSTLHKLGHKVGIVSGGFLNVIEPLLKELNIDYYRANTLEVVDGKLTGRIVGEIVDRKAKADSLQEFAAAEGVPLSQTIAIGDGANDLDMINLAGLGIAFNAKPKVQELADTTINNPYLDSVLYFMGISREELAE